MNSVKLLSMLAVSIIILSSGCERRNADPTTIAKEGMPPAPVIQPGTAGAPPDQGLASTPGSQGVGAAPVPEAVNVTAAEILKNPATYVGKTVTMVSRVEEIFTPWSFKMAGQKDLAGDVDNGILVVGAIPLTSWGFDASWINSQAKVTGTVRILQAEDFQREYGRGVDDLLFRRFESKPAIIARSVEKAG